jgi:hypothetical protein
LSNCKLVGTPKNTIFTTPETDISIGFLSAISFINGKIRILDLARFTSPLPTSSKEEF